MSTLNNVPCPRCFGSDSTPQFKIQNFQFVDCSNCGMRYVNPRKPDAQFVEVYDKNYFRSPDSLLCGYEDYEADRSSIMRTFKRRWKDIIKKVPLREMDLKRAQYLDIGCAYGCSLEIARDYGMSPLGVDVSAHAIEQARKKGLMALVGGLDEASNGCAPQSLKLVTSWDVIEHVPNPRKHIEIIAQLLEPEGILSLITPDRGSITARIFGSRWVEYQKPEEHIQLFRSADIYAILKESGFEVVSHGTAGKYVSIKFALERLKMFGKFFSFLAQHLPFSDSVVYVNPHDKMHIVAKKIKKN